MRPFALLVLTLAATGTPGSQEPAAPAPPPAQAPAASDPEQAVLEWVARRSVPIESTDPEAATPGEDLAAIGAALEGVRVVGVGEANRGSSEFFTFRHRLLRHLVRAQGFRVLAFESHHAGTEAVDDYVRGGESTLEQALAGLGMRIWQVEEMADMLRWLRAHNQAAGPSERVRFRGIDMQGVDRPSASVAAYLARVDPQRAAAEAEFQAELGAAAERAWNGEVEALAGFEAAVDARLASFALERGRFVARSSVAEYERALADLCVVAQFVRAFGGGRPDARDRFLADNVLAILADEPTAKVVLFAHDVHVQRGELGHEPPGHFAAGEYLARDLGSAYYALGLALGQGSFQALELNAEGEWQFVAYEVGPPPPATVGWLFSAAGLSDAFLDLRGEPQPEAVQAWLDEPRGLRWASDYGVPAGIGERWKLTGNVPRCRIAREYDGLVYVAEVRRASPLP